MLARIHSFVLNGIDPLQCDVEVDVSKQGLERIVMVGLPQAAVKESIERVRRTILNSEYPVADRSQAICFLNQQIPLEPYELDGQPYQTMYIQDVGLGRRTAGLARWNQAVRSL